MKKKLLALVVAVVFCAGFASLPAQAKTVKCEVTSVKGSMVTMDCGHDASGLKAGERVKIKASKKRKKVEGC